MKFIFLLLVLSFKGLAGWSVSTYNIRNFDKDFEAGQTNLNEIQKIIKNVKSDVMAFQEVVNRSIFLDLIKKNLPGYSTLISSCGGLGKQHLALVFNSRKFDYVRHSEELSLSGDSQKCAGLRPALFVTLKNKLNGAEFTFALVHLKSGSDPRALEKRWDQYEKLMHLGRRYQDKNFILLGDFNTTGYLQRDLDFDKFKNLLQSIGMRSSSDEIKCSTYWPGPIPSSNYIPSLLDHIVFQEKDYTQIESISVGAHCLKLNCMQATPEELGVSFGSVSDHCPIKVVLK